MKILRLSLLSLLFLTGCSLITGNQLVIYPITPDHIFAVDEGTQVGNQTTTQDGCFISDFYMKKIIDGKVK